MHIRILVFYILLFFPSRYFSNTAGIANNNSLNTSFVENKGQFADKSGRLLSDFQYKLELPGLNAYFKPQGIVYHFYRSEAKTKQEYSPADKENFDRGDFSAISKKVFFFRLDMVLLNANPQAKHSAGDIQQQKYNYYLAHCPQGIMDVSSFGEIEYKDVYPGIDMKYFVRDGNLKYEFIVHPGADIKQIRFLYRGAESLFIEKGRLNIVNKFNTIVEDEPLCFYRESKQGLRSSFSLTDSIISFNLENFDRTKTIVIDPAITWASYYSQGSSSDFHANSAFDSNGNIFTAFATYTATWPVINAGGGQYYDAVRDGITDVVIARINSNYSKQWATYYGGDQGDYLCGTGGDYGKTIGVDASDNVYIGGYSSSPTSFPTQSSGVGGAFYQSAVKNGDNSFLIKFNGNGVRQWATLFNHENVSTSSAGIKINGICVNGSKVYFTGQTYKWGGFDIPLRNLAGAHYQATYVGDQDSFVGRFDSNCLLEWCSYLNGGNPANKAYKQGSDLTIDASGNLLYVGQISGASATSGYLLNPGGGAYYNGTFPGGVSDLQITKFNSSMVPTWSTYYGGTGLDRVSEVSADASGNILIACRMANNNGMPTLNPGGAFYYTTRQSTSSDGFIMKFTPAGVLYWATYVGGTNNSDTSIPGISSDNTGAIYAIGYTNTTNFPTLNLSGSYYQSASGGGQDMVLMKFTSGGVLSWSTYYGGTGSESCYGVKIDASAGAGTCGGYKQFNCFAVGSNDLPTVDPGGGAFYESSKSTANANAVLLISYGMTTPPGGSTWTWTGAVDTDWHTACNWDKQSVPNTASNVVIPGGTSNNPTISSANADCYDITINSSNGAVLTISGTRIINISKP